MPQSFFRFLLALFLGGFFYSACAADKTQPPIGIVIMHGKGGSPAKFVAGLAAQLERQGLLVANIEMPWSGRRDYDVDVAAADGEVEAALEGLRGKGAQRLFVAGHSQGGLFALHFGGGKSLDGVIAIAPGGNPAGPAFREKLGPFLNQAQALVAEGKGDEKVRLADYEGSRGVYPVVVAPKIYLSWFEPEGALHELAAVRHMNPATPVLFITPTRDYAALLNVKQQMFDALPKNPLTKLYEPDSSHIEAPSASVEAIVAWIGAVIAAPKGTQ